MDAPDLAEFLERYRASVAAFITGDPEPQKLLWSRADDATLANPLGPPARGWEEISRVMDQASGAIREGQQLPAERVSGFVTNDLAYKLEIEHSIVRVGDAPDPVPVALRATTIFRRETDGWKIVHRHADTVTSARSPDSLSE
jgi:ketosteroid isomerase-like protein